MLKVKKTQAGGFYLFQGKASANSVFLEDLIEAKQFIISANYYFKGYLKIHEYLLSKDGWSFIVTIECKEKIALVMNCNCKILNDENIWRIISERVRIFLSCFVKFTNKKQGRSGGKVHSSYERYIFDSLWEALQYIAKIKKGIIKLHQSKKRYRGKKSHYKVPKKLGKGSIFISSKKIKKAKRKYGIMFECYKKLDVQALILQNLVKYTQILHKARISNQKPNSNST